MHLDYEFNMNKQIWESTMVDISLYFLIFINIFDGNDPQNCLSLNQRHLQKIQQKKLNFQLDFWNLMMSFFCESHLIEM